MVRLEIAEALRVQEVLLPRGSSDRVRRRAVVLGGHSLLLESTLDFIC